MEPIIDFYYMDSSSCSRMILMILEELKLKFNSHFIIIGKGEHMTESYRKINPRQRLPTIKDGDLYLAESRAIATYLMNKYGAKAGKQELYPIDPKQRAVVDKHLYISADFWRFYSEYCNLKGILNRGDASVKHEWLEEVRDSLRLTEETLTNSSYIAAEHLTLADIFYFVNLFFLDLSDFDEFKNYPKLQAWRQKMSALPYNERINEKPHAGLKQIYQKVRDINAAKMKN